MAKVLVVLYSSNDTSRNFPAQVPPSAGATIINWATDDLSQYFGPSPSEFPSVICSVMVGGIASPSMVGLIDNPADWNAAAKIVDASDNQDQLTSISPWGSSVAGAPTAGPLKTLFNQDVVLTKNGLNPQAQQQLPLILPILSDSKLGPTYWGNLKSNPPDWLDSFTIDYVENLSKIYAIPILIQAQVNV